MAKIVPSSNMHGWTAPGFSQWTTPSDAVNHAGEECEVVKACEPNDKHWDVRIGKTIVKLKDGTKITVLNDEVVG
jgi:hypothetical protein